MMQFEYIVLIVDEEVVIGRTNKSSSVMTQVNTLPKNSAGNVCVLLGGADVSGFPLNLPSGRQADVRRAASFAIEDDVAVDLDDTHVAIGDIIENTPLWDVRIVGVERMESVLADMKALGIPNAPVYSVADCFAEDAALYDTGRYVYGRSQNRVFGLESSTPNEVFAAYLDNSDAASVYGASLARALGVSAPANEVSSGGGLLGYLAQHGISERAVDLRQGAFAARRQKSQTDFKGWRTTMALASLVLVGWLASMIFETRSIEKRAEALASKTNEIVAEQFPEAEGNYNTALQLYLNRAASDVAPIPSVLDVSSLLYKSVTEADGDIRSLRYDFERGEAVGVVAVPNFELFEAIAEQIKESGLEVFQGDARQQQGQVVGELRVRAGL